MTDRANPNAVHVAPLSAADCRCRPVDTENGFTQGPVFKDWRGGISPAAGSADSFFTETPKDSQLAFRRAGCGRDGAGADDDGVLVAGFEPFELFESGAEGAAVELIRCCSRVNVWSPCRRA